MMSWAAWRPSSLTALVPVTVAADGGEVLDL